MECQRLRVIDSLGLVSKQLIYSLSCQHHLDKITFLILEFDSEDVRVKLVQDVFYLHDDKLEHRIGVDVFVLSKELFDPSKSLTNLHKVVGCLGVVLGVEGRQEFINTGVPSDELEDGEEVFF